MARVISMQQVAPTDYRGANALFNESIENINKAFSIAKDTVSTFGQDVRDRNHAVLNSFINNIHKDDWNDPRTQVAIHNMLKDMSNNTAGMVDLNRAFDVIDKRQSVLTDRDNARLENQLNQLTTQNKQDEHGASNLVALDNILSVMKPEELGFSETLSKFNDAYTKASPLVKQLYGIKSAEDTISSIQRNTQLKNANFDNLTSTEKFNTQSAKALVNQITQARSILSDPNATDEQKQQAFNIISNAKPQLEGLRMSANTLAGMFIEAEDKQKTEAKEGDKFNLEVARTKADIDYKGKLGDATVFNAMKPSSSGGTAVDKNKLSPPDKRMFEMGLYDFYKDGKLQAPQIGRAMVNILDGIRVQEQAKDNEQSFEAWINGDGKKYREEMGKQGFWLNKLFGVNMRYDDIVKLFPSDATAYEKKEIIKALSDKNSDYARYFKGNDGPEVAMQNALRAVRMGRETEIKAKQRAKYDEIITDLSLGTHLNKLALYGAIIKRDKTVGWDAPDWFVELDPVGFAHYNNLAMKKGYKPPTKSTPKTDTKTPPKKTHNTPLTQPVLKNPYIGL